jgi:hypothetical protein
MSGNPLIMDSTTANWAANLLPGNQALAVFKIIWQGPGTAADTFTIVDLDGQVLIPGEASTYTIGSSVSMDFQKPVLLSKQNGWHLSQISSGKIYIYY